MRILFTLVLGFSVIGCSGTLYTVQDPGFELTESGERQMEGVLVYGYERVEKKILLDRIRNQKSGEITHSMYAAQGSDSYCEPRIVHRDVVRIDYDNPYALRYDPALFETSTFSVDLEKGSVTSVNTEATPGPKTAVESLQELATLREDILDGVAEATKGNMEARLEAMSKSDEAYAQIAAPIACSVDS